MNTIHSLDSLMQKRCQACEGGVEKYTHAQAIEQLKQLGDTWQLSDDG